MVGLTKAGGWLGMALAGATLLLGACKASDGDSGGGTLPAESGSPSGGDSGQPSFTHDTFRPDSGLDLVPEVTLGLRHVGRWDQTPVGGPYAAMTGELDVEELLDGNPARPWCRASFALTGLVIGADAGCDNCDTAYEIEFFLVSEGPTVEEQEDEVMVGGLADCYSPDLPSDGERWRMAWSEIDAEIYLDFYGSGIWLPWYAGESSHDRIDFSWVTLAAFHEPEMEE